VTRLGPLETEVMKVLWRREEASAEDVQTALGQNRRRKPSTIRTILTRLENKGYAEHRVDRRTYHYSAKLEATKVFKASLKNLLRSFCNNSVESLLRGIVHANFSTSAELKACVDKIANARVMFVDNARGKPTRR
jgi:predicted transcriptional regulator